MSILHSQEWIIDLLVKKALQEITEASNMDLSQNVISRLNPETSSTALVTNQKKAPTDGNFTTILDLDKVREYLLQFGVDI